MVDLSDLGIRTEVLGFFSPYLSAERLLLDDLFVFSGCKLIGTENVSLLSQVFFCSSVLEAIAFLNLNLHWFPSLDQLLFIAAGSFPDRQLIHDLGQRYSGKKISLILENDLLGKVWSVKMAGWISGRDFLISYSDRGRITVAFKNKETSFSEAGLNLNAFQLSCGLRLRIKSYIPRTGISFADELLNKIRGG